MVDERIKEDLWLSYFTETLYKKGLISEKKKIELEKLIMQENMTTNKKKTEKRG